MMKDPEWLGVGWVRDPDTGGVVRQSTLNEAARQHRERKRAQDGIRGIDSHGTRCACRQCRMGS